MSEDRALRMQVISIGFLTQTFNTKYWSFFLFLSLWHPILYGPFLWFCLFIAWWTQDSHIFYKELVSKDWNQNLNILLNITSGTSFDHVLLVKAASRSICSCSGRLKNKLQFLVENDNSTVLKRMWYRKYCVLSLEYYLPSIH